MNPSVTASPGRAIVIVGVDRSGTSMVSNMVHVWGAYGGDVARLARTTHWNRYGNWENREQRALIRELLRKSGPQFWDAAYGDVVARRAREPRLRTTAEGFVAAMAAHPFWFCKEPWLSVQLPFWKQFWGDAVYIITLRNPRDCASSLAPFMVIPKEIGTISLVAFMLLRWQIFLLSILRDTNDTRRKLFVEYERLIRDPRAESARICEFLCRECGGEPEDRACRMAAVVRSEEQHWRGHPFSEETIATDAQQALYAYLRRKVDDADLAFDASRYPMSPSSLEYFTNMNLAGEFVNRQQRLLASYPVRAGMAVSRGLQVLRGRLGAS